MFTGDRDGYVMFLDAGIGRLLWKDNVGGRIDATPISYSIDGRQYVAVAAGSAIFSFGLPAVGRRIASS